MRAILTVVKSVTTWKKTNISKQKEGNTNIHISWSSRCSYHRGSREEWSARSHLVENAADSPHVDRGGILRWPKQDVRRAVPQGDHLNQESLNTASKHSEKARHIPRCCMSSLALTLLGQDQSRQADQLRWLDFPMMRMKVWLLMK